MFIRILYRQVKIQY